MLERKYSNTSSPKADIYNVFTLVLASVENPLQSFQVHVILRYGKIKVYDMVDSFCLLFYMGHISSCEHAFYAFMF